MELRKKQEFSTRAWLEVLVRLRCLFRNHIRVVAVALAISLFLAAMFSAPHAEGAGATFLTPPQAGEPTNLVVTATTNIFTPEHLLKVVNSLR
jgi:hypothetical protein